MLQYHPALPGLKLQPCHEDTIRKNKCDRGDFIESPSALHDGLSCNANSVLIIRLDGGGCCFLKVSSPIVRPRSFAAGSMYALAMHFSIRRAVGKKIKSENMDLDILRYFIKLHLFLET